MATVATLLTRLEVNSAQFHREFTRARSELDDFASGVDRVGRSVQKAGVVLTAGLTIPLTAAAAAGLKFSNDLSQGMANVASLIPGATDRILELREGVRDLSPAVRKGTGDLTDGLYEVVSAFGDTSDTLAILETNALAAAGGLATTQESIRLTSAVTKAWGDTSAQAVQQAADLALLTVRLGQTTFPELAGNMGKVIPLAETLGVSLDELFGSFATFTGVTGDTAAVATQLSAAFRALLNPTPALAAELERLGFASGDALIEARGLQGSFQAIVEAAENTGTPLQQFLGRAEAMTLILNAAGSQAETFAAKTQEMAGAAGTVADAVREQQEGVASLGSSFVELRLILTNALSAIGDALAPFAEEFVAAVKPVAEAAVEMAEGFKDLPTPVQGAVVAFAGFLAALGPILTVVGTLIVAVGGLTASLAAASAAGIGLTAVLGTLAIITGVGVAIAALVALVVAFGDEFVAAAKAVGRFVNEVRRKLADLADNLGPFGRALSNHLRSLASEGGAEFGDTLVDEVKRGLKAGIPDLETEITRLRERMEAALGAAPIEPPPPPDWEAYAQNVLREQIDALQTEADTLTGLWDRLKSKGTLVGSGVSEALVSLHTQVTQAIEEQGSALTKERLELERIQAALENIPVVAQDAFTQAIPRLELEVGSVDSQITVEGIQSTIEGFGELERITMDVVESQANLVFFSEEVQASFVALKNENKRLSREFSNDWADLRDNMALLGQTIENKLLRVLQNFTPQGLLSGLGSAVGSLGDTVLGIVSQFNPLALISQSLTQAFREGEESVSGLQESLGEIVAIMARAVQPVLQALVPIFQALVPVFEELAPVLSAVGRIFAALFQAIAPILKAMVPLLRAFFPIFKQLAVLITYVGQVLAKFGQIVFKIGSFLAKAIGNVVRAIGKAIDAIPFVSGKGIIRAGENLINWGNELDNTSKALGEAAIAFGDARETIRNTNLDDPLTNAANAADKLAESATRASGAMQNVPSIFKAAARAFEVRTVDVGAVSPGTQAAAQGGAQTVHYHQYSRDSIRVDAKDKNARELFKELEREESRQNMIQTGNPLGLRYN